ncbi:XRE family transcriptional regulator [uncultured Brachyspira sp.]|uniref:helix-turn-helix domain-containing protein n=1 Tax=uncultured Brachyspira sp. TaxID=221953 RepID=UPI002624CCC7|nr:XRE family transcriptional regulator [uncultured Brachyspira sp.]
MANRDELLPQILRHLRESKRMTIEMVANYLEVTADDIKAYESGRKKLRSALFIGLSSLYSIPLNVFELKEPDGQSVFHYRRKINKELGEYSYTLYGYMNNIIKIYKSDRINVFNLPASIETHDFDKDIIKENALILRKALKLSNDEPIPNLPKILDNLGIEVVYTELPIGINGVAYTLVNQDTNINSIIFFIANNDDLFKQSFSIAHEFCHVMMHNSVDTSSVDIIDDKLEESANYFANVFLLPPNSIGEKIDNILKNDIRNQMKHNSELYKMCYQYGVSVKTILWSIYHADKINKEKLNELCLYYENLSQEEKFPKYQGIKDNYLYNKKMQEAVEKNIITKQEYDFITGFHNYASSVTE